MLQRLLVFRSVLVIPYMRRRMPHVEMNTTNDTSIGNREAPISKKTVLRGISSDSKAAVWKHLGLNKPSQQKPQPNASAMARNNVTNESTVTTSVTQQARAPSLEMSFSYCSEKPQHPSVRDVVHEDTCSFPSVSSGCDGSGEGFMKESQCSHDVECPHVLEEHSLPKSFGKREQPQSKRPKSIKHSLKDGDSTRKKYSKNNTSYGPAEMFDICQPQGDETDDFMFLREPQDFMDEAKEAEMDKLDEEPRERVLRPGMILLKSYISDSEQVSIVRKCRELGIGRGGFYQPAYKYRAKLRLHMMCLGLDWDPETRKYQKTRRIDKSKPPDIPVEFHELVDKAMLDSLALIGKDPDVSDAEDILPKINPDICIVNFYSETGRLGLHQDRDESTDSLKKGLPVVSFSVGNSAEFLYGDQRDPSKAEKQILDSGDVLIFGGQSRHVFHGVASIIPNSAPRFLLEETNLLPGRLNLTFRQY